MSSPSPALERCGDRGPPINFEPAMREVWSLKKARRCDTSRTAQDWHCTDSEAAERARRGDHGINSRLAAKLEQERWNEPNPYFMAPKIDDLRVGVEWYWTGSAWEGMRRKVIETI